MQAHKDLEKYRNRSADTCLSSVVDMPKQSAKRNTDEANARQAYKRADENPLVWRPSVKRLPDERLTKPASSGWYQPPTMLRKAGPLTAEKPSLSRAAPPPFKIWSLRLQDRVHAFKIWFTRSGTLWFPPHASATPSPSCSIVGWGPSRCRRRGPR